MLLVHRHGHDDILPPSLELLAVVFRPVEARHPLQSTQEVQSCDPEGARPGPASVAASGVHDGGGVGVAAGGAGFPWFLNEVGGRAWS